MALTMDVAIDDADWTQVNVVDVTSMIVQMKTVGKALLQVADTKPPAGDIAGIVLDRNELGAINLPGLAAGNIVWVKALDDEATGVTSYQVTV